MDLPKPPLGCVEVYVNRVAPFKPHYRLRITTTDCLQQAPVPLRTALVISFDEDLVRANVPCPRFSGNVILFFWQRVQCVVARSFLQSLITVKQMHAYLRKQPDTFQRPRQNLPLEARPEARRTYWVGIWEQASEGFSHQCWSEWGQLVT